ncbi:MAG: xanthine dehydrogenase family protein molybdopterin-binding subunit [Sphingobium sp.]|nr:xanthine dehydrogenase family protein molybdopterin-binding subunit [Sphingobium sp.]
MERFKLDRRRLLTGAAVGGGLLLAWTVWPRRYNQRPETAPGEYALASCVKIDRTGQVIILCPQAELGQGVFTVLAQILADELGADWRTIAVQPAPPGPLFANTLLAKQWLAGDMTRLAGSTGDWAVEEWARREMLMLTGGSTSVPMFAQPFREAGAAARVLLCQAAATRWGVTPETCDIVNGIVSDGTHKARIGDLVEEAAKLTPPEQLPFRPEGREDALVGTEAQRLDVPSKIDGSANYAADIRLPDMIFAAIRQGPVNAIDVKALNEAAARKVPGFVGIVREQGWVAVTARNWWAANQALDRLDPAFTVPDPPLSDRGIARALDAAFDSGNGQRFIKRGDLHSVFDGASIVKAHYSVAPALHLALEPMAATARVREGDVEVWVPTQAPVQARRAVAKALGVRERDVTIYPLFAGGSFGRKMEHEAGVQAALIARAAKAPVQLMWSRAEDIIRDVPRAPAKARMAARIGDGGLVRGWLAEVSAPAALAQSWQRVGKLKDRADALAITDGKADRLAVDGFDLPYSIPNFAVDHFPADVALPTGRWRGNAASYATFFSESFVNELARAASVEPMSFRMQMLGGRPRLAHCLTSVATMGGWQGGEHGSGQGIACAMLQGGHIAVMVEAGLEGGRVKVARMVAVVDCGAVINPDIARQQIEGGLIFGLSMALGCAPNYAGDLPKAMKLKDYNLPRMADVGEIVVEVIESDQPVTGVGEIGVLPVAPALAAALTTITGKHYRHLPIIEGAA